MKVDRRVYTPFSSMAGSRSNQTLVSAAVLFGLIGGCASLPPQPDLPDVEALVPAETGLLGELGARFSAENGPGESGFALLSHADDAFLARLALVDSAEASIDAQYFIWQGDATGHLLFSRLQRAAERGVRVRLLVDDMGITAKSHDLAVLSSQPNFEIRVYNPNPSRDSRVVWAFRYLASFKELNRRMHNKLLIADNRVAITGGRNIGDEYFGLAEKYNFRDVDVITIGAVVPQISAQFDEFWNDEIAYPSLLWASHRESRTWSEVRNEIAREVVTMRSELGSYPIEPHDWTDWLADLERRLDVGQAHFLQDDPVDIEGQSYRLIDMIRYFSEPAHEELVISTPYLIPVDDLLDRVDDAVSRGVRVRFLTASLGSNNHTTVHSHYKKYRRRILATGAELYEFHHDPPEEMAAYSDAGPTNPKFVSLHAKVIVADREQCFVGSLNFDPRAIVLNTENGLLIRSPELASKLADELERLMAPDSSWRISVAADTHLRWESALGVRTLQPARHDGQRVVGAIFRLLPIESQL